MPSNKYEWSLLFKWMNNLCCFCCSFLNTKSCKLKTIINFKIKMNILSSLSQL